MKTKQEMIDDCLVLIAKHNDLAKEKGQQEISAAYYKALFRKAKKCYIGVCSNLILNKINSLKNF